MSIRRKTSQEVYYVACSSGKHMVAHKPADPKPCPTCGSKSGVYHGAPVRLAK